jgi:hypothetical protein
MRMSRGPTATTCAAWARTHVGAPRLSATEASGWRNRHQATGPPSSPRMLTLSTLGSPGTLCGAEVGRAAAAGRHPGRSVRPARRACWNLREREAGHVPGRITCGAPTNAASHSPGSPASSTAPVWCSASMRAQLRPSWLMARPTRALAPRHAAQGPRRPSAGPQHRQPARSSSLTAGRPPCRRAGREPRQPGQRGPLKSRALSDIAAACPSLGLYSAAGGGVYRRAASAGGPGASSQRAAHRSPSAGAPASRPGSPAGAVASSKHAPS